MWCAQAAAERRMGELQQELDNATRQLIPALQIIDTTQVWELRQKELEQMFGRPVFLDSDDLRDLRNLREHVRESEVMIVVQTSGVLTRPYCLLELYTAVEAGRPLVGVTIDAKYDFQEAREFLQHLDTELEERNPGAIAVLKQFGLHPVDAA